MSTQFEEVELENYAPPSGPTLVDDIKDKSEVRWFFNPAAKISVRDRVTGNELNAAGQSVARSFIRAGTLVPLRNTTRNLPHPKAKTPPPGSPPQPQSVIVEQLYAKDIAEDLAFAYADTGAQIINSLTGIEDEALVRSIFRLCVGAQIKVATDPLLPGEKVPVIPAMLETLNREAPQGIELAFAGKHSPEDIQLRATVEETRRLLIAACNAAVSNWARLTTQESRKSIADRSGGHPGKAEFDDRDRRAFAAMGESIPTDIQSTKNATLEKAVELLLNKELQPVVENPRIAMLEKALQVQGEMLERLTAAAEAKKEVNANT